MVRLVERDATGPRRIDASDIDPVKGDVAICQCGLSNDFPFCDGSHRVTEDESEGVCYRYVDDENEDRQVVEQVVLADENTPGGS